MKKKIEIFGNVTEEAEVISAEEFKAIKRQKDTPTFVIVDGKLWYNDYTCLGGFSGTCNCLSHPRKSWTELNFKEV